MSSHEMDLAVNGPSWRNSNELTHSGPSSLCEMFFFFFYVTNAEHSKELMIK